MSKRSLIIATCLLALPVLAKLGPKSGFQVFAMSKNASSTNSVQVLWARESSGHTYQTKLNVNKTVLMDDSDVRSAAVKASNTAMGPYVVWVALNKRGTKRFEDITRDHLNEEIVIMVDGKVVSAPFVRAVLHTDSLPLCRFHTETAAAKVAQELKKAVHK